MGKYTPNPTIRILMLGSVGVGKNCIESRFTTSTYPPPYNPALTLTSRRFFTLPPVHAAGDSQPPAQSVSHTDTDEAPKKSRAAVSTVERPPSATPTLTAAAEAAARSQQKTQDAIVNANGPCSACTRENNTYLVELINYPDLQSAGVRRLVHAKADYDAVLLVYNVADRASFGAIADLHAEIPVCTRKNHHHHHRKAVHHASATRSRTSGWFGGGGGNEADTTGSGEIVVGLVGNMADCDDQRGQSTSPAAPRAAGLHNSRDKVAAVDADEDSLLSPLYHESIMYEELMAGLEKKDLKPTIQPERLSSPAASVPAGTATSPVVPNHRSEEASKKEDIEKWLQISRLDQVRDTFGSGIEAKKQIGNGDGRKEPERAGNFFGLAADNAGAATPTTEERRQITVLSPPPKPAKAKQGSKTLFRQVPTADGETLAQALQLPVPFLETSAKTGSCIEQAFENLVREVLREMGQDASGTNKAGKTCRHRIGSLPVTALQQQNELAKDKRLGPQHHQHHLRLHEHHHYETPPASTLTSPKAQATVPSVAANKGTNKINKIHVVHDVEVQRPESAVMFGKDKTFGQMDGSDAVAKDIGGADGGSTHQVRVSVGGDNNDDETQPILTVPQEVHRRGSMIGRMRNMFVRRSQQTVMRSTDIAV